MVMAPSVSLMVGSTLDLGKTDGRQDLEYTHLSTEHFSPARGLTMPIMAEVFMCQNPIRYTPVTGDLGVSTVLVSKAGNTVHDMLDITKTTSEVVSRKHAFDKYKIPQTNGPCCFRFISFHSILCLCFSWLILSHLTLHFNAAAACDCDCARLN